MTESLQAQKAKASLQAKLAEDTFNDPEAARILRRMGAATTNVDALLGTCGDFMLEPVKAALVSCDEAADEECSSDETLQLMRSLLAVLQESIDDTDSDEEDGASAVAAISQLVRSIA